MMKEHLSCSEITKRKIAMALKELMETEPFDKITVSDISDKCGMHRQTFYYHFKDRHELLDWLLYNELISSFVADFSYKTMNEKFFAIFDTIYNDKKFYQNAIRINTSNLYSYLSKLATRQFSVLINELAKKNNIEIKGDITSIAEFFGFGLGGLIISWIDRGTKESPQEMTDNIKTFVDTFAQLVMDNK